MQEGTRKKRRKSSIQNFLARHLNFSTRKVSAPCPRTCHSINEERISTSSFKDTALLLGLPKAGKSTIFNRLQALYGYEYPVPNQRGPSKIRVSYHAYVTRILDKND